MIRRAAIAAASALLFACGVIIDIKDIHGSDVAQDAGSLVDVDASSSDAPSTTDAADATDDVADSSSVGDACDDAACEPIALTTNQGDVAGVAIDDQFVYFTSVSTNAVARVPKTGGATQPVASGTGVDLPRRIAVNASHVYWVNADLPGTVVRCPVTGCSGTPEVMASPDEPRGLALAPTFVYWTDRNGGTIGRRLLAGGAVDVVATTASPPVAVAVDVPAAFWVDDFSGEVYRNQVDGGRTFVSVNGQSGRDIALDQNFVYWASAIDPGDLGRISRAPRTGGGAQLIGAAGGDPAAIALDGTRIYWTATRYETDGGYVTGNVFSCPRIGCNGAPEVVASNQDHPTGIAIDTDAIYWGVRGGVMKVRKR